jgi:hypothetical protein
LFRIVVRLFRPCYFRFERLVVLHRVISRAPFSFNDFKQLGALLAATRRIAVIRHACIFADIYKRGLLVCRTAAPRLGSSGLCPPSSVV